MGKGSEPDLAHYRRLLLQRRAELQGAAEVGQEAAQPVELDQARVGRLSRMDALQGQAMSLQAKRRREQALRRIAAALAAIEQGVYGDCRLCGEPIAAARLDIDPVVTLCIACAEKTE